MRDSVTPDKKVPGRRVPGVATDVGDGTLVLPCDSGVVWGRSAGPHSRVFFLSCEVVLMQFSRHADLLARRNAAVLVAGLLLTLATIGSCTHKGSPASGDPAESDVAVREAPRQETGSRSGQDEAGAAGGESGDRAKHPRSSPALEESLRQAALDGRLNAVRAAIKDGADVSACDGEGRTALMLAAFGGHQEIVDVLLAHGTDVNQRAQDGFTALIYAASGPGPKTVEILLDHGAEVDAREDREQFTALMYAANEGQIENVKLLLRFGANPSLKDADGDTAADFAQQRGHEEILRLLRQGPQQQ